MSIFKKISLFSLSVFVSGFLLANPVAHAMTPTLSLSATGDGNTVQVTVNGDPNVSVIFYYTKVASGNQVASLGTTNASGYFSTNISTSAYQITPNSSVYVTTNGISGPASNNIVWPISLSSTANTLSLSQTGVVLSVGQSSTVTASGVSSVYLSNNSNPPIANINISGDAITIVANAYGSTVATICSTTTTSSCASIYVTVENSGAQALTFGQNNLTIVAGQSVPISISGGTGLYMVQNNPNSSVVQTSINGSTITLSTTATSGASSITVCSTDNSSCGIINVTVGTASASAISFSPSNPTVSVGQGTSVTISGASGGVYYISSNSNPSIAQTTLSSNILTIVGNTNGSSLITVCSSLGNCGSLTVTVNYVASGGTISLSQSSLALLTGQTLSIVISGGTAPYNIINNSPSVAQTTLSGNILTVYGASVGSETVNVCSAAGGCISLSVLVNGSGSSGGQLVLSQTSLSLAAGQTGTIVVSGNGSYYLSANTYPNIASAQMNGSSITVTGIASGTDAISVCQNGGQCIQLSVSVNATSTTALPTGCLTDSGYSPATGQSCGNGAVTTTTTTTAATPPPASQSAYVFARYLGYGDTGADVLQLQQLLAAKGYLAATPTGHYGPATVAALKKFQAAHSIKQTGEVGPATKDALNQVEASGAASAVATGSANQTQISQIQQVIQQLMTQIHNLGSQ